jgi:hypothetical protein
MLGQCGRAGNYLSENVRRVEKDIGNKRLIGFVWYNANSRRCSIDLGGAAAQGRGKIRLPVNLAECLAQATVPLREAPFHPRDRAGRSAIANCRTATRLTGYPRYGVSPES